jgi:hypothetical protein
MVRRWGVIAAVILMVAVVLPMVAQEKDEKDPAKTPDKVTSFYKLDLTVREMDGSKVVSTRNYTLNQLSGSWARFRVGSKIPIGGSGAATQYIEVGLNADCHIMESESGPFLNWTIDLSSVAPETVASGQPVIRNVRSSGQTTLSFNKPIVLSSSDDLNSTHKFVFEVTATKVK